MPTIFAPKSKHHDSDNLAAGGNGSGMDRHEIMHAHSPAMIEYLSNSNNEHASEPGLNVSHVGGQQHDFATSSSSSSSDNMNIPHPYGHHHVSGRLRRLSNTDPAYVGSATSSISTDTSGPSATFYRDDADNIGIPPPVNHGHSTSIIGTGHRLTGKVESAIGSMVGSNTLKAKGLQKEQEANLNHNLANGDSERLEDQTLNSMHRERAVAHGAHPSNSAFSAGRAGTGVAGSMGPDAGF